MWGYNDKKPYIVKYLLPDENFDGGEEGGEEGEEGGKLFFIGLIYGNLSRSQPATRPSRLLVMAFSSS